MPLNRSPVIPAIPAIVCAVAVATATACAPSESAAASASPGTASVAAPARTGGTASTGSTGGTGSTTGAPGIGDPDFPGDGNGGYDVEHYDLTLSYDPASRNLAGSTTIRAKATQDLTSFDLDLHGLTVSRVTVDGAAATFSRQDDELVVTPARRIADGGMFAVAVDYSGVPRSLRSSSLGEYGFIATPDGAFVTCEPNGAKTWFPSNDHPADKATYDFQITVPAGLTAIANGEMSGTPRTTGARPRSSGGRSTRWRAISPR